MEGGEDWMMKVRKAPKHEWVERGTGVRVNQDLRRTGKNSKNDIMTLKQIKIKIILCREEKSIIKGREASEMNKQAKNEDVRGQRR